MINPKLDGGTATAAPRIGKEAEGLRLAVAARSYGESAGPFDTAMRGYMMRSFESFFTEGPCLQVGCAQGDQTELLAERFKDLTVVEPVQGFLEQARARVGEEVAFEQILAEDFQTEKRFETIMLTHVLEHVEEPTAMLRQLGGLLTDTGTIYVVVPNALAPSRRIAAKMGLVAHLEDLSTADRDAGHRRVYTLETLSRDVREAGLESRQMGGIFYKPLANFQMDALIGGPLIGDAFMEACYSLGHDQPSSCASIYVAAGLSGCR